MTRVALVCALAAMVAASTSSAEARPRKHVDKSHVDKSHRAKKKPAPPKPIEPVEPPPPAVVEPEDEEQPADDLAAKIDALTDPPAIAPKDVHDPTAVGKKFPGIRHWIHPIVRAEQLVASFPGGEFGAGRKGVPRSRGCGGHCGVDLHAERGRPIVAVAAGTLVHVERRRSGGDGLSGRYVRIRHADGTFTTYMHLDSILEGLEVGDQVTGGQQLGTLGSTGVRSHTPHLHFELEIPAKADGTGDHKRGFTRWIDAAPFLRQSHVIDTAVRKRAAKPTS